MRSPFIIKISDYKIDVVKHGLYWKELSWTDAVPLHSFFRDVLTAKEEKLSKEDKRDWRTLSAKDRARYRREAHDMMFKLRDFKFGINQLLPAATVLGIPNLIRRRQTEQDGPHGILGRHFAILRSNVGGRKILGISVLEKTGEPDEAELSYWKRPYFGRPFFLQAVREFMLWSCDAAGYRHFKTHIQASDRNQRPNWIAERFAYELGFRGYGVREASAPDGNGKRTLILKARDWPPQSHRDNVVQFNCPA